jgi:SAM-dependent methyltransferase
MTALADKIQQKFFKSEDHPYRIYEKRIGEMLKPESTLMDAGCGYTAPILQNFKGKANRLVGVDLVDFRENEKTAGIDLIKSDLSGIDLASESIDLIISRSVLEHIKDIEPVYREMHRLLKPNGHFFFMVPNLHDYVSLISWMVPNDLHSWIVAKAEGRDPKDTFPAFYKSNTHSAVSKLARKTGFELVSIDYLGQYPSMLKFNAGVFALGTAYEKLISGVDALKYLRGWIMVDLVKK